MQGIVSVLAVTGVQDRVKGEGAGNDGVRGVTVGTDRHPQHWEAAVRLFLKRKKGKVYLHSLYFTFSIKICHSQPQAVL